MEWKQEFHETAARTANRRARQLRRAGYQVSVGSMGNQVTPVGVVKMTLLTVHDADDHIPAPIDGAAPVRF